MTEDEKFERTESIAGVLIEALKKYTSGPEEAIDVVTTVVGMLAILSEDEDNKYPKTSEFVFYHNSEQYRVTTSVVKVIAQIGVKH